MQNFESCALKIYNLNIKLNYHIKFPKKEWIKMVLPVSITHIDPFYEYDRKKKEFKKPIITITREMPSKKK